MRGPRLLFISRLIVIFLSLDLTLGAHFASAGVYQPHRRSQTTGKTKKRVPGIFKSMTGMGDIDLSGGSGDFVDHLSQYGGEGNGDVVVPTYCGRLIESMAALLELGNPDHTERAGRNRTMDPYHFDTKMNIPDLTILDPVLTRESQRMFMRLFGAMYGTGYEMATPPAPSEPIGQTKILMTVAAYHQPGHVHFAIPVDLIRYSQEEDNQRNLKLNKLAAEVSVAANKWEEKGRPYQPEPVIQVSQAIGRLHSHPVGAGARGSISPLLNLITVSLDDYLSVMSYAAEVDRMQVKVVNFLAAHVLNNSLKVREDEQVFRLLEGLLATAFKPSVAPLPEHVSMLLELLLNPEDSRLNAASKSQLQELLNELWDYEEALLGARRRFGESYQAGMMCFYLVTKLARPSGFRAIELSNLMRQAWIKDLNNRHMVLIWTAAKLLNKKGLRNTATDSWLDLAGLMPNEVIQRYVRDTRLHEMVVNVVLSRESFDAEFDVHSRIFSLMHEKAVLATRIDAATMAAIEGELGSVARDEIKRVAGAANAKFGNSVPLLNLLLKSLERTDPERTKEENKNWLGQPKGPKTNLVVPRLRELPGSLPYFIKAVGLGSVPAFEAVGTPTGTPAEGSGATPAARGEQPPREALVYGAFHESLKMLDQLSQELYEQDINFQTQNTTSGNPIPSLDGVNYQGVKSIEENTLYILKEVLSLKHAMEHALYHDVAGKLTAEEKKGFDVNFAKLQARADAAATLAHEIVGQYPALARLVIHDTSMSALTALQRRVLIETIRDILAHPEEVQAEFGDELNRFGERAETVMAKASRNKWKIVLWSSVIVGSSLATYLGYGYFVAPKKDEVNIETSGPVSVDVQPGTNIPQPPEGQ